MSLFTVERSSQGSPVESSSDEGEGSDSRSRCSSVDAFWTSKNIAICLPSQKNWNSVKQGNKGQLSEHLQQLVGVLRPNDRCSLAVELESSVPAISRYLVIISFVGVQEHEESICLGVEYEARTARVAMVVPIYCNTQVKLSGDGRFTLTVGQYFYLFKPVSVQCMWATIQKLHEAIETATVHNYYHGGMTHTWIRYYQARLTSDRRTLSDWACSEEAAARADSPGKSRRGLDHEDPVKDKIVVTLRKVMQNVDLECATSKEIRSLCEAELTLDLRDYRGFIDQEMLVIMGQMEQPSQIFDFLYLGSEWNASNIHEMKAKGIGYILNVTCEIDNFFPDSFHYYNIRVWDTPETDLLKHWDDTYQFIKKAISNDSKVLVHCKMGVSRSASTVTAFAMKEYKWQLKEALDYVKSKRDCANPNHGFVQQLRQYEGILGARHNPVWGKKATRRKRVTVDVLGPVPPATHRTGSSPDSDGDDDDEDDDDDGEPMDTGAGGDDGAATASAAADSSPFLRTSSATISNLKLKSQRPKSWAGMKREEAVMREQNINLYFQSLLSEQQKPPEGCSPPLPASASTGLASKQSSAAAEAMATSSSGPVPTACAASASAASVAAAYGTSASVATAVQCRQPVAEGGHRRASAAKSLDLSSSRAPYQLPYHQSPEQQQQPQHQLPWHDQQQQQSVAHARSSSASGIGDFRTESGIGASGGRRGDGGGGGGHMSLLSAPLQATASPEDTAHTPVDDLQPSALQIESGVNAALVAMTTTTSASTPTSHHLATARSSSAESDSVSMTSMDEGSPCRVTLSSSPQPIAGGASGTGTVVRVRDKIASIESRHDVPATPSEAANSTSPPSSSPVSSAGDAGRGRDITANAKTHPQQQQHHHLHYHAVRSTPPVRSDSPLPTAESCKSPVRSEESATTAATAAAASFSSVTRVERPSSAGAAASSSSAAGDQRASVEVRPQIKSVHRRIQSIERFKIFSPSDLPADPSLPSSASQSAAVDEDTAATSASPSSSTRDAMSDAVRLSASPLLADRAPASAVQQDAHHQQQERRSVAPAETAAAAAAPPPVAGLEQTSAVDSESTPSSSTNPSSAHSAASALTSLDAESSASVPTHTSSSSSSTRSMSGSASNSSIKSIRSMSTSSTISSSSSSSGGTGSDMTSSSEAARRHSACAGSASVTSGETSSSSSAPGYLFSGFSQSTRSSSGGSDSHRQAPSPKVSRLSASRPGGRAMSLSTASRRTRPAHPPYTWQNKKSPAAVDQHSPGQSPTLRRAGADGFSRHSPQSARHRTFSLLSPRTQRRSRQGDDKFVTFIPSRCGSSDKQPTNFQSLLEQFRDMSQPKNPAAAGTAASSHDTVTAATSSSSSFADSQSSPLDNNSSSSGSSSASIAASPLSTALEA